MVKCQFCKREHDILYHCDRHGKDVIIPMCENHWNLYCKKENDGDGFNEYIN